MATAREYKYTSKHVKNSNSNIFVRLEDYLMSVNELKDFLNCECASTNIEDKDLFLSDLVEYETNLNAGRRKEAESICYGVVLRFLLPNKQKNKVINNIFSILMSEYFNDMPYYAKEMVTYGQGHYVYVYVCQRNYYPMGKEVQQVYTYDQYKNKNTQKICKATDEDAVLFAKKGDVKKTKEPIFTKFSSTLTKKITYKGEEKYVRYFHFASNKHFETVLNEIKEAFIQAYEQATGEEKEEGPTFKRYTLGELNGNEKTAARLWHKAFLECENEFTGVLSYLNFYGILNDKKNSRKLRDLFLKFNYHILTREIYEDKSGRKLWRTAFNYEHVSFNIDFQASLKEIYEATGLFIQLFKDELLIIFEDLKRTFRPVMIN